tara:strand:+ start:449 stop:1207 length:759 start_codon:yes stop_codon:yes gene_type:complete
MDELTYEQLREMIGLGVSKVGGGVLDSLGISKEAAEKIKGFGNRGKTGVAVTPDELAFDSDIGANGVMEMAAQYKKNAQQDMSDPYQTAVRRYFEAAGDTDAIQNMQAMQGLEEPLNTIGNLGIGARGLDTPAEREFMARDPVLMPGRTPTIPNNVPAGMHRMPDGSLMKDSDMDYGGTGEVNPNPTVVDRNQFNKQFAALNNDQKSRVEMMMAQMDDQQKADFAAGLTGAPLSGYAVQDERYDYMRRGGGY